MYLGHKLLVQPVPGIVVLNQCQSRPKASKVQALGHISEQRTQISVYSTASKTKTKKVTYGFYVRPLFLQQCCKSNVCPK